MMKRLLEGIKVLDLTRLLPGPFCTMILADLGAEVIKVEMPNQGDLTRYIPPYVKGMGSVFFSINRNKKSMTLDLKKSEGRKILHQLVEQVDVVVESFRPESARRLGLSYDQLRQINPSLIHISITGFGQESPYRDRPGHDLNYLGYAGLLFLNPRSVPLLQIADVGGGSLWGAIGILAALWKRSRDPQKKGMYIDLSLVDGAFSWWSSISGVLHWLNEGFQDLEFPLAGENHWYRNYETKDGKYITFACLEPWFWEKFCLSVEKHEWLDKQHVDGEERKKMHEEMEKLFRTKTRDEWVEMLAEFTCVGPVLALEEAVNDSHVQSRGLVDQLGEGGDHLRIIRIPLLIKDVVDERDSLPPELGEHTEEILRQLGYEIEQIQNLKKKGII